MEKKLTAFERMEPNLEHDVLEEDYGMASVAISLKRIADSLEELLKLFEELEPPK